MIDLRIKSRARGRPVTIRVNGRPIAAYNGETVFAALLAAGIHVLGHSAAGRPQAARGGFCGMGVCQECRLTVDGLPDRRACMTEVHDGMEISIDAH